MKNTLKFLQGKKGAIASIIVSLNGYFLYKGIYGEGEFILISSLITIFFGTVSHMTKSLYLNRRENGTKN